MRRSLFAAASITVLAAAPAWSQDATEIEDERTEPVDTATAGEDGTAADIVIASNGRVVLSGASGNTGPAVLINSDNSVELASGARVEVTDTNADGEDVDLDDATGVQMQSGSAGDFTSAGRIVLADSHAPEDADDDGEADGPFARDRNKTGFLAGEVDADGAPVAGQAPVDGSVTFESGSRVEVGGQDSYGVRIASGLTGDLLALGGIGIRGERSTALSVEGDVGGDVQINTIDADTPDGHGAVIDAEVGGGLRLTGSINVNGYRIGGRLAEETFKILDQGDDDVDAGSAVIIAGSVRDGVFIGANAEIDLISGKGAAVEIGSSERTVTLGEAVLPDDFNAGTEPDEDEDPEALGYALVNAGAVTAQSPYDGRDATAFLIAGHDSNGVLRMVVLEAGGMENQGVVTAVSYDGVSRGVVFGEGASAVAAEDSGFVNRGEISATAALGYAEDGFADGEAHGSGKAFGIVLAEGSQLNRLLNARGSIIARVVGGGESATAITVENDATGLIENTGLIQATATNISEDFDAPVRLVAIDASTATQDLRIVQRAADAEGDEAPPSPFIDGDILFGSGDDTLELRAGSAAGDVDFGAGENRLIVENATLTGGVTNSGALTLDVADGRLVLTGDKTLDLTEATFASGGVLEVEVNSTDRAAAFVNASGDVTFENGSALRVSLANLVGESADVDVITADGTLSIADDEVLDTTDAPFLYNVTLTQSEDDPGTLVLSLQRKSAEETGLDASRAAAYDEALAAFEAVEGLGAAFAGVRTQQDFFNAYNQLLPEYATSAIQFALASNDAAAGALSVRLANARLAPDDLAGVWAQEFGYFADRASNAFGPGYRGQGVGLAVGLDRPMGPFYAVGFSLMGAASEVEEIEGFDEPMVAITGQVGTYAALDLGGFDVSGALGLGYDYFESERNILIDAFSSTNTAEWTGWHLSASAQAGRDFMLNNWIVRPEASLSFLSLFESGYTETVEDAANAGLALVVDDRESAALLGAATLSVARRFGTDVSWWAPSVRVGYRGDFLNDEAETTARFGESGAPFTLRSQTPAGSGVLLGFGLSAGSDYSTFSFAYDADVRDDFVRHVARLVIRLTF